MLLTHPQVSYVVEFELAWIQPVFLQELPSAGIGLVEPGRLKLLDSSLSASVRLEFWGIEIVVGLFPLSTPGSPGIVNNGPVASNNSFDGLRQCLTFVSRNECTPGFALYLQKCRIKPYINVIASNQKSVSRW